MVKKVVLSRTVWVRSTGLKIKEAVRIRAESGRAERSGGNGYR